MDLAAKPKLEEPRPAAPAQALGAEGGPPSEAVGVAPDSAPKKVEEITKKSGAENGKRGGHCGARERPRKGDWPSGANLRGGGAVEEKCPFPVQNPFLGKMENSGRNANGRPPKGDSEESRAGAGEAQTLEKRPPREGNAGPRPGI